MVLVIVYVVKGVGNFFYGEYCCFVVFLKFLIDVLNSSVIVWFRIRLFNLYFDLLIRIKIVEREVNNYFEICGIVVYEIFFSLSCVI